MVNITPRPLYPRERISVKIEVETTGCTAETVWTFPRRENRLSAAGIQTANRPACSQDAIPTKQQEFSVSSQRRPNPFSYSVRVFFFFIFIFIVILVKLLADVVGFLSTYKCRAECEFCRIVELSHYTSLHCRGVANR